MPPIGPHHFKAVAKQFKNNTGLGIDLFHPGCMRYMSDEGWVALAGYLSELKKARVWPEHGAYLSYFMIPKPEWGGEGQ